MPQSKSGGSLAELAGYGKPLASHTLDLRIYDNRGGRRRDICRSCHEFHSPPLMKHQSSKRHEVSPLGRLRKRDGGTSKARVPASMVLAGWQQWGAGLAQEGGARPEGGYLEAQEGEPVH